MFDRDTLRTFKRLLDKCPDRIMDALDSLSKNQFESKDWLVDELNKYPHHYRYKTLDKKIDICLLASWYGLLAYRLIDRFSLKKINNIDCIDYDPMAKAVAKTIWYQKHTENLKEGKLSYVKYIEQDIKDIEALDYPVVICTSCEHLEQSTIYETINKLEKDTLVVLQSNDYRQVSQHINCVDSMEDFANQYVGKLRNIKYYEKDFGKYKRFMVIGTKI